MRILAFNQIDFPLPMPTLELFFASDRVVHRAEELEAGEAVHGIFRREAFDAITAMLVKPGDQVGRDADVEGSVLSAGENVDAGLLHDP